MRVGVSAPVRTPSYPGLQTRKPGRPRGLFHRQGDKPMYRYQQDQPEITRPGPAEAAARLRMQSALLSLTVIINILCLYLVQSDTVIGWIVGVLGRAGAGERGFAIANELFTLVIYLTVFLLPYIGYAKVLGFSLRQVPHDPPHPPILAASASVVLGLSVVGVLLSLTASTFFSYFGLLPADLPMKIPGDPVAAALYIFNATALPALIEEFTYRGVVLVSLRPFGDRFAIVVSALLFGLLHRNMVQFPNAFLLGLALGYFMVKTNSIWTSMAIHFLNNFLIVLFALFPMGVNDMEALVLQGLQFLVYLTAGGFGFWYLYRGLGLDGSLRPCDCPLRERTRYRRFFLNFPMLLLLALYVRIFYLSFTRM